VRGDDEPEHWQVAAQRIRAAACAERARESVTMRRVASRVGRGRLRAAISPAHISIGVAVISSVLICAIITWLHFHQRDTFQRVAAKVDGLRQSRIDLAQAFLHVTLAGGASSPFERATSLAALKQAI